MEVSHNPGGIIQEIQVNIMEASHNPGGIIQEIQVNIMEASHNPGGIIQEIQQEILHSMEPILTKIGHNPSPGILLIKLGIGQSQNHGNLGIIQ